MRYAPWSTIGRTILIVERPDEDVVWGWFGGRSSLEPRDVIALTPAVGLAGMHLALGEPAEGLSGWRLSHRQAKAAFRVAQRGTENVVRYAEVALLAALLDDELLTSSLRTLYLKPLLRERDGGKVARETLRAYFAADRNVSSAAAALGVKRHTVTSRLRHIEKRFGRQLNSCAPEVEAALYLDALSTTHD